MAYNYDRDFLIRHAATVEQLKDLVKTKSFGRMEFVSARDLRASQHLINNLLRCLVLYEPEYSDIRQAIRTWTQWENEKWVLYVGIPTGPARGAVPKIAPTQIRPTMPTVQNALYEHPNTIGSSTEWMAFGGKLDSLPANVVVAKAVFKIPPKMEFVNVFDGWQAAITDNTVVYTRTVV